MIALISSSLFLLSATFSGQSEVKNAGSFYLETASGGIIANFDLRLSGGKYQCLSINKAMPILGVSDSVELKFSVLSAARHYASDFEIFFTTQINFENRIQYIGGSPSGSNYGNQIGFLGSEYQKYIATENSWTGNSAITPGFSRICVFNACGSNGAYCTDNINFKGRVRLPKFTTTQISVPTALPTPNPTAMPSTALPTSTPTTPPTSAPTALDDYRFDYYTPKCTGNYPKCITSFTSTGQSIREGEKRVFVGTTVTLQCNVRRTDTGSGSISDLIYILSRPLKNSGKDYIASSSSGAYSGTIDDYKDPSLFSIQSISDSGSASVDVVSNTPAAVTYTCAFGKSTGGYVNGHNLLFQSVTSADRSDSAVTTVSWIPAPSAMPSLYPTVQATAFSSVISDAPLNYNPTCDGFYKDNDGNNVCINGLLTSSQGVTQLPVGPYYSLICATDRDVQPNGIYMFTRSIAAAGEYLTSYDGVLFVNQGSVAILEIHSDIPQSVTYSCALGRATLPTVINRSNSAAVTIQFV